MDKANFQPPKNHYFSLQRIFLNLFFALTFITIITINIDSYYQVSKFTAANLLVARNYQVTQATDDLLLSILNIESVARGYMITGDLYIPQAGQALGSYQSTIIRSRANLKRRINDV